MFVKEINDKHMFALRNACDIKEIDKLEDDRPKNNERGSHYITIDIDLAKELDSSKYNSIPDVSMYQPIYAILEDIAIRKGEPYNPTKMD